MPCTWSKIPTHLAKNGPTEKLYIGSYDAVVTEGVTKVRFDNQGGGCSFDIPIELSMDERKIAVLELGFYHMYRRLENYRDEAIALGANLPPITDVDAS